MDHKKPRQAHNRTHGETGRTVENKCWKHMKEAIKKHNIPFDEEWNSYEKFLADVGRRPSIKHKFKRLDTSKGFFKNNCRWIDTSNNKEKKQIKKQTGFWTEWQHEYRSWISMIYRCTDPNKDNYFQYGGSGITVCDRWLEENGFKNFCYDMGHRPTLEHTLHRKNNSLGYSPDNCMWLKSRGQSIHRRSSRFVQYKDYNFNMSTWAEILDMNYGTFKKYIYKGMTIEEILKKPVNGKFPRTPEEYLQQFNDRISELYPDF